MSTLYGREGGGGGGGGGGGTRARVAPLRPLNARGVRRGVEARRRVAGHAQAHEADRVQLRGWVADAAVTVGHWRPLRLPCTDARSGV